METMKINNVAPKSNGEPVQSRAEQAKPTEVARRDEGFPSFWGGSPFATVRRMMEDMDRMFDDWKLGKGVLAPPFGREWISREFKEFGKGMWSPQIEVFEKDQSLVVRADLPGMKKEEVAIEIGDGALVLRGERKQEQEEKNEGFYRSERSYGSFYRQIPIPPDVDADKGAATFKDGVLEIVFPLPERKNDRRRIEIQ